MLWLMFVGSVVAEKEDAGMRLGSFLALQLMVSGR